MFTPHRDCGPFRVKGHPANPNRLYAVEWVRSAILVFWALGLGVYIVTGMMNFSNPIYTALVETFHDTKFIGGVLILAAILGIVGTWGGWVRLSKVSAVICAVWHAMFFGYTIPANFGVFGLANLVSLFSLLVSLLYVMQFFAIAPAPAEGAIRRRLPGKRGGGR